MPFVYRSSQDELDYLVDDAGMSVVFREEDGAIPDVSIPSLTWAELKPVRDVQSGPRREDARCSRSESSRYIWPPLAGPKL